ncbi:hypothetical protein PYW08_009728 [Mythimna loreyi]|uniref:Uncharacterized protein n=1 Tax=Mythimna loreyi TaxID=667449 RepID=A0ACC2Q7J6_9NEOP|nr:hypothetical protein PYW08_009728 [Mythimna loreyi]
MSHVFEFSFLGHDRLLSLSVTNSFSFYFEANVLHFQLTCIIFSKNQDLFAIRLIIIKFYKKDLEGHRNVYVQNNVCKIIKINHSNEKYVHGLINVGDKRMYHKIDS